MMISKYRINNEQPKYVEIKILEKKYQQRCMQLCTMTHKEDVRENTFCDSIITRVRVAWCVHDYIYISKNEPHC